MVFVLLLVRVYPSKKRENSLNLLKHGFLSATATVVTLVAFFSVMVPAFPEFAGAAGMLQVSLVWLHAVLGILTFVLAVAMIVVG